MKPALHLPGAPRAPQLAAALLGTALLLGGCASEPAPGDSFGIYLTGTGDPVLTGRDLEFYDSDRHEFTLNEEGIRHWNRWVVLDSTVSPPIPRLGGLYGKEFTVRAGGEDIYHGRFWSMASSLGMADVVNLDVLFPLDADHRTLRLALGYPPGFTSGPDVDDPRNDPRILAALRRTGRLR